jgi:uncharacterized protein
MHKKSVGYCFSFLMLWTVCGASLVHSSCETPQKKIRILSIDGGGQRGLVSAILLKHLEDETQTPILHLFDAYAGTSTGSLIVLGITMPRDRGFCYGAGDLVDIYKKHGAQIFEKKPFSFLNPVGLFAPRYSAAPLKEVLTKYFGTTKMSQAVKPVYVTSYDLEKAEPILFSSKEARACDYFDFEMRKIARASCAAPTYFPTYHLTLKDGAKMSLSDGCFWAINPALAVYDQVREENPDADITVVSLGTGTRDLGIKHASSKFMGAIEWGSSTSEHLLHTQNSLVHESLKKILKPVDDQGRYFRINFKLDEGMGALDDASPESLSYLTAKAQEIIDKDPVFQELVNAARSWRVISDEGGL